MSQNCSMLNFKTMAIYTLPAKMLLTQKIRKKTYSVLKNFIKLAIFNFKKRKEA